MPRSLAPGVFELPSVQDFERLQDAKCRALAIADECGKENELLRAALKAAVDLLEYGRSGYVPGSHEDSRWNDKRRELLARIRDDGQ